MLVNTLPRLDILVPQVALDPILCARAAALAATRTDTLTGALGQDQQTDRHTARVSDAGRCSLELYAFFHDELNLPDDGVNMVAKLHNGTMFGWWLAALEAIAISEALKDSGSKLEFKYEQEVYFGGVVPGHIDLGVWRDGSPWWLIENKSTYSTMPLSPPHLHAPQQVLQAAAYAVEGNYPDFSILTIGPAVQGRWDKELKVRVEYPKLQQCDYMTDVYREKATAEMKRLVDIANADEPPQPDIDAAWRVKRDGKSVEAWRCKYCRHGACPKNDNPIRLLVE